MLLPALHACHWVVISAMETNSLTTNATRKLLLHRTIWWNHLVASTTSRIRLLFGLALSNCQNPIQCFSILNHPQLWIDKPCIIHKQQILLLSLTHFLEVVMAMALLEKHTAMEHFPLSLCKKLTITKSKNENLKFACVHTINLYSSALFSSH